MSLVRFLVMVAAGTILAWVSWVAVLLAFDPVGDGALGRTLFYVSLWLAMVGTLTLIGFFVRYWWEKDPLPFRQIGFALRQAVILGSTIIIALGLQAGRILTWWSGGILILIAIATEAFFLAGQTRRSRPTM